MNNFFVSAIKDRIKMPDLLQFYGFEIGRGNRIACPFHNGEDKNLGFKNDFYNCFVCGCSGDIIKFTQDYFGLTFSEALQKLNDDFSLGLPFGKKLGKQERLDIAKKSYKAKKEREKLKEEREAVFAAFWVALDDWIRLDTQLRLYKPREGVFELHPLFVEALKNIGTAEYRFECAKEELYKL